MTLVLDAEFREIVFARMKAKTIVNVETGCWEWQGFVDRKRKYPAHRYGQTAIKGKTMSAHRAMYIAANGEIAKGLEVCHTCDNPVCINPAHLWLGTHKDNMADSRSKGRHYVSAKTHCKRGHELSGENLYYHAPTKSRHCKACGMDRQRRRIQSNRAAYNARIRAWRHRKKAQLQSTANS